MQSQPRQALPAAAPLALLLSMPFSPACLSFSTSFLIPKSFPIPASLFQAIASGVDHDLELLGERVRRLTGPQGTARLEAALAAARAAAAAEIAAQERQQQQEAALAAAASAVEPASPSMAGGQARWAELECLPGGAYMHFVSVHECLTGSSDP